MLEKMGFQVELAENGIEAVDIATRRDFDLVLMGCQVPLLDGYDATKRIKNFEESSGSQQIPIIAVAAHNMTGNEEKKPCSWYECPYW